jgi:hypothetical protein
LEPDPRVDERRHEVGGKLPIRMKSAAVSVTPMITGTSMRWIACQVSWPMPGQPKTASTTTAPPMKMPMSSPTIATIGSSAFLSA